MVYFYSLMVMVMVYKEEEKIEEEILDWYSLSPSERFIESLKLWEVFLLFGGDYDPEPDTQSPFYIFKA